ncbi:MAG: hypothetical protein BMS9Abin02_1255 [Anaerolineae bacterium]|nr:MAG: hypothetical protein BMS9Abin02_1255 [Anaerolineae bacterium]
MYAEDVELLSCPVTGEALEISSITQKDDDADIVEGELRSVGTGNAYEIRNGIPRLANNSNYNPTWDYKWTIIDAGRGLNYRMIDEADPAYRINDLFDSNGHGGAAFRHATGRIALDIGCGVGQYTIRLLKEYSPKKVVSMDLTRGVDIFRQIILERYPDYKKKILLVQGNVFELPFREQTFDYVFSLGVLMHTGDTLGAIKNACSVLRDGGHLNIWVYASSVIPSEACEKGRHDTVWFRPFLEVLHKRFFWLGRHALRNLPHGMAVFLMRVISSDTWYLLTRLPLAGKLINFVVGTCQHPDRDYRYINNYDAWVNTWDDTWSEHEIFPILREQKIVVQQICPWRVGFWGVKQPGFYMD